MPDPVERGRCVVYDEGLEAQVPRHAGGRRHAVVGRQAHEDQSLDVIRLDGLQRGNAEVGSGEHVNVAVAQSRPATRVVFAPADDHTTATGRIDRAH